MTDDPEPIEYHHSEAYVFSTYDQGPNGRKAVTVPAFEYNTGPAPNWHLHVTVPFVDLWPGDGTHEYGLGDIELGVKYRFVYETGSQPQVGVFPMLELPTGDTDIGLGNGQAWGTVPLWLQKSFGPWTTYGGGGRAFNSAAGMKDYNFAGWLVQRSIAGRLILGGEVFYQGAPSEDSQRSTFFNVGGYYTDMELCGGCSLLFRIGSSIAGEVHHEAYLGLYWSWDRNDKG